MPKYKYTDRNLVYWQISGRVNTDLKGKMVERLMMHRGFTDLTLNLLWNCKDTLFGRRIGFGPWHYLYFFVCLALLLLLFK